MNTPNKKSLKKNKRNERRRKITAKRKSDASGRRRSVGRRRRRRGRVGMNGEEKDEVEEDGKVGEREGRRVGEKEKKK